MKRFDELARVALEKYSGDSFVTREIKKIEAMSRAARERGQTPPVVLADKVQELKGKIHMANRQMASDYQAIVSEAMENYERQREKKPELELARMRRAEMLIDSMDKKEQADMAQKYAREQIDLTMEEANILASRLKGTGDFIDLKRAIKERKVNQPWTQDPQVKFAADEAKRYASLQEGHVVVSTPDGKQAAAIETLIDFDGYLDKEK